MIACLGSGAIIGIGLCLFAIVFFLPLLGLVEARDRARHRAELEDAQR